MWGAGDARIAHEGNGTIEPVSYSGCGGGWAQRHERSGSGGRWSLMADVIDDLK